jgi:hypothetical protein
MLGCADVSARLLASRAGFVAALALCATAAAVLRPRAQALATPPGTSPFDVPRLPAEVVRPFSFGLRSLVADVMFMQAIQIVGAIKKARTVEEGGPDDRALDRLLTYATDLDPKFGGAYRFAGYAMPRHTAEDKVTNVLQAEAILRKGVRERPDDWRIPFELGFIQSYYLGHFDDAAQNLAIAARAPGSPKYLGLLATRAAADAGDLDFAESMARVMAAGATEESTRDEWQKRLLDLRMERDLRGIEAAIARYKARTGHNPPSLQALVEAKDLPGIPREPHGGRYQLGKDGEPRSTAAARLRIRGRAGTTAGMEVK